jgi:succinylglutamic semialdehyde dehydrogenase
MKFSLKGDYFNSKFHLSEKLGPNSADKVFKRECPADLDNILWECSIKFGNVEKVVDSALKGFKEWKTKTTEDRISYLRKYQEIILSKKDEIAQAIALETGKPLWEAHTEVSSITNKVDVTIKDSLPRIQNKTFDKILPETNGFIYHRPIGPALIIGPFNFPCHLANGQIVAALLAGNSIIFKPSEKTCYSAQLLIECFEKANFPEGVINLIQGDGETGRRLLAEKAIKGVFFTGSKEVGLAILSSTHKDLSKLVALELGGKNSSILCKDTNIDYALLELLKSSFLTTGQRCTKTAIIPIHESIKDEFISKFHQLAKKIIIDHPIEFDKEPFMGPLVDQSAVENYLLFMGMAKREGVEEIMRGKQISKKFKGHYVSPSIHLSKTMDKKSHFLMSEIFGPNCTFIPFKEIEEAIEIANSTEYGLVASVFTKDKSIFQKCLQEIEAGLINLNRSTIGASARLPFGGVKNSGNYRPASVATIDACVFQQASLEVMTEKIEELKGLNP